MLLASVIKNIAALSAFEHRPSSQSLTCVLDTAVVVNDIQPHSVGKVVMHGVYWKAKAINSLSSQTISIGQTVSISHRKGLTLYVSPEGA